MMTAASASTAQSTGLNKLADGAILSPFTRINRLLEGIAPGNAKTIIMTAGDPTEKMPGFVIEKMKEAEASLGSYPKIRGSDELRAAIAEWIGRRYGMPGQIDPMREVCPVNGSREALFFAALPAVGRKRVATGNPVILMPNPFYQAYMGAGYGTNAEIVLLAATEATGHLPDLDALELQVDVLKRTAAFYLCSPANPQGAIAPAAYVARALALARQYDFMLFFDECYSEIYNGEAPIGGLEVAVKTPKKFKNIIVFNSLSKRSNLPGLRSGFVAGDGDFIETFAEIRNLTAPQMPGPVQHASAAVWAEEQHVVSIRQAYRAKYAICDAVLGRRFGYQKPAGGFFLWLNMKHLGGGTNATVTLWKEAGVKVTPGAFLAQDDPNGVNPGHDYIRVALVHDVATIREALTRIVQVTA